LISSSRNEVTVRITTVGQITRDCLETRFEDLACPTPSVSVITVMKKEDEAPSLPSLRNQECEQPFEIVLVRGGNRSQARNLGIVQSRAPLISFIDSDCEAPTRWLANLMASLPEDQIVAGVGGVSSTRNRSSLFEKAIDAVFSTYLGSLNSPSLISVPDTKRYLVNAISGHNCIYRRAALIEVGGFDSRFQLNEDTDICARLREKGYRLLLDRSISVYHERRGSVAEFARQFFWYGVGRIRSMLTGWRYVDGRILGLFVLAVCSLLLAPAWPTLIEMVLSGYAVALLWSSSVGARRIRAMKLQPLVLSLFVVEHFSYLAGLASGIVLGRWKESMRPESMGVERYLVLPSTNPK